MTNDQVITALCIALAIGFVVGCITEHVRIKMKAKRLGLSPPFE